MREALQRAAEQTLAVYEKAVGRTPEKVLV